MIIKNWILFTSGFDCTSVDSFVAGASAKEAFARVASSTAAVEAVGSRTARAGLAGRPTPHSKGSLRRPVRTKWRFAAELRW